MFRKSGFTLAEVLITLVIIGVIAAMTIPTLIQHQQKEQYVAGLKKAISTMTQATDQVRSEYGEGALDDLWASVGDPTGGVEALKVYAKYLSIAKDCGSGIGCLPKTEYYLDGTVHKANFDQDMSGRWGKAILADGSSVMFVADTLSIDVNGMKGPNTLGRDMFLLVYDTHIHQLTPYCGYDVNADCNFTSGKVGNSCAAKILKEGGMNY